jgi:hypothetical protein
MTKMSVRCIHTASGKITGFMIDNMNTLYYRYLNFIKRVFYTGYGNIYNDKTCYLSATNFPSWESVWQILEKLPNNGGYVGHQLFSQSDSSFYTFFGSDRDVCKCIIPWISCTHVGKNLFLENVMPSSGFGSPCHHGYTTNPLFYAISNDKNRIYVTEKDSNFIKVLTIRKVIVERMHEREKYEEGKMEFISHEFQNPKSLWMDFKHFLCLSDDNGVHRIDLNTLKVEKLFTLPNISNIVADSKGKAYAVANRKEIYTVINEWNLERLLWIGNLKSDESCPFSRIPSEIVYEIVQFFRSF